MRVDDSIDERPTDPGDGHAAIRRGFAAVLDDLRVLLQEELDELRREHERPSREPP